MTKVTASDIDGNQHEIDSSVLTWRPSAYAVVIKDGRVLLLKQKTGYDLPGGGIEFGETAEEAVVREVFEESGIAAGNPRLLGLENSFFKLPNEIPSRSSDFIQALMIYYACDYVEGEISITGFDEWEKLNAESAEWVDIDTIDGIKVASSRDYRPYIRQAIGK